MAIKAEPTVLWRPHPGPQTEFLSSPYYEVFYGGAAGGGKSDCLLVDALGQVSNRNYRALILRKSFPELSDLILRSRRLYPEVYKGARYNEANRRWTFPSGAAIEFGYLDTDADAFRYQGQEFTYVAFDELTHFSEWGYQFVCSRVRSTDPTLNCYVRATSNPGGQGHHWVKSRFIDPAPAKTPIYDDATGQYRLFIPSLLKDNPSLAATDYGRRLMALPEADRKALLEGDWDAYTGTVFQLLPNIHVWTWDQFTERTGQPHIPDDWPRFRVMDWGFARPFAIYWVAVDRDGRGYVYREWYGVATDSKGHTRPDVGLKMEPSLVAERIAGMEANEKIQIGWTGPDLFSAGRGDTTAGITIYEWFAKVGVFFNAWNAGRDSRYAKKQALHERLKFTYKEDGTIAEWPGLIFLDNCKHAIRTIPALEYDEARAGEDINSASEDHCLVGETVVDTLFGKRMISDIAGTVGLLWSWNGSRKVLRPYFDCRKTQTNAIVGTVEFEDGRTVTATHNHRFLTEVGEWVQLRDLTVGMSITNAGSVGIMPSEVSADGSDCNLGHHSRVSRQALLQVRSLLSEEWEATAQGSVGVLEREDQDWLACPPQGPRQVEQQPIEPDTGLRLGACEVPHQHGGVQGRQTGTHAEEHDSEGGCMAQIGRRPSVAQGTCQEGGGNTCSGGSRLFGVWGNLPFRKINSGLLFRQVWRQIKAAIKGHHADDHGKEAGSRSTCVGTAKVKAVTLNVGSADVFNLEVIGTHNYSVSDGIIVHNCYDAVSAWCLMRPWKAKPPKPGESWKQPKQDGPKWM